MNLKDLAIKHDYYANETNYFSHEATGRYETWVDFYEEFHNKDIDYNLVYRWDIEEKVNHNEELTGQYQMQVTIIKQRKGIYMPCLIDYVYENDVPQIIEFMKPHFEKLFSLWSPLNKLYNNK